MTAIITNVTYKFLHVLMFLHFADRKSSARVYLHFITITNVIGLNSFSSTYLFQSCCEYYRQNFTKSCSAL